MTESLALLLVYLGVVAVSASSSKRLGKARVLFVIARAFLAASVAGAVWLLSDVGASAAAWLVALSALMLAASAVALLRPIAPRVVFGSALLAAIAVPLLVLLRGSE